ncbi:hypothetical protein [Desulfuromonas acetoxidans]|uniref:hypothetical protein n=1 Tax=Desulfuromonas acetoxidans TaxID=891 RepID=UPI00292E779B|nr:hypothetical protein [Desulfuromonas acetoxidans]
MAEQELQNGELSLSDLVAGVWRYRVPLFMSVVVGICLSVIGVATLYFVTPSTQTATLSFRVLFEGADKEQYPNGLPFSPTDILAGPVLQSVYQENALDRFVPFDEFKGALFISETNEAITLLDKEYQQKLSNSKLSTVDRQILEDEYREKRRSLSNESFKLNLAYDGLVASIPDDVMNKVLKDVLETWVVVTETQKGVLKYRVPIYSRNILPLSLLASQDYIVTIDIFSNKIDSVFKNIEQLEDLPGAQLVRVGDSLISLEEIVANLHDTQRYKLDPLVGLVRSTGLSKDPTLASLYLENQLFQINLDQKEAQDKINVLEKSLTAYMEKSSIAEKMATNGGNSTQLGSVSTTYIPQFGDSFLDRLVEMSSQSNDVEFRQKVVDMIVDEGMTVAALDKKAQYYRSLIDAMKRTQDPTAELKGVLDEIKTRFTEIESDIVTALDNVNEVYRVLSSNNLNPQAGFYTITAPLTVATVHAVNVKKVFAVCIAFVFMLFCATGFACLLHLQLRHR